MNTNHSSVVNGCNDEIDLFELARELWKQRIIIIFCTSLVFIASAVYVYSLRPVYQSSLVIMPPAVGVFGPLAKEMSKTSASQEQVILEQAIKYAKSTAVLLEQNLISTKFQEDFKGYAQVKNSYFSMSITEDRASTNKITIEVSGYVPGELEPFLNGVLEYAATSTAQEINDFFSGMGIDFNLKPENLYRIESPAFTPVDPIKPKKTLILALGLVLGGMLGVFVALIRGMLGKYREKTA